MIMFIVVFVAMIIFAVMVMVMEIRLVAVSINGIENGLSNFPLFIPMCMMMVSYDFFNAQNQRKTENNSQKRERKMVWVAKLEKNRLKLKFIEWKYSGAKYFAKFSLA